MTIARSPTIPAEFIRFDSQMTDADRPFCVRDAQTARENLNILIARRLRHPLLVVRFRRDGYAVEGAYIYGYGMAGYAAGAGGAPLLGPWRIWIPPYCQMLTLRLRAKVDTVDGDVLVYPVVRGNVPGTGYYIAVTGTSDAEYELDIPVTTSGGGRWTDLYLPYTCDAYGPDEKGTDIVVAWAGDRYVVGTTSITGGTASLLYFTSPAGTIQPQRIIAKDTLTVDAATYDRAYVADPWNVLPVAGDTFNTRALAAFIPSTLTVIPKAITDFGAVLGLT